MAVDTEQAEYPQTWLEETVRGCVVQEDHFLQFREWQTEHGPSVGTGLEVSVRQNLVCITYYNLYSHALCACVFEGKCFTYVRSLKETSSVRMQKTYPEYFKYVLNVFFFAFSSARGRC